MKIDPIERWISTVCSSHSDSKDTCQSYSLIFNEFCNFIEKEAEQIIEEYKNTTDRNFKMEYANHVQDFMGFQQRKGTASSTIRTKIAVIKSFFKYNNLPLGFIPQVKITMTYHNRDITHKEVQMIISASRHREKAIYSIIAQSGLRPVTVCKLKYKHIKSDFENGIIPCKIDVPQELAKGKYRPYFTFIGEETVNHLKDYFLSKRRTKLNDDDYLFLSDDGKKNASRKSISNLFAKTVKMLNEKGLLELEQKKKNKPHNIRLYNLRKFFRKYANQAGFEFVQFWMGHTVNAGVDESYRPTDPEFHRKLYSENAMPHLRLETSTPSHRDKAITDLQNENKELKEKLQSLEEKMQTIITSLWKNDTANISERFKWHDITYDLIQEIDRLKKRQTDFDSSPKSEEEIELEQQINKLRMMIKNSKEQRGKAYEKV